MAVRAEMGGFRCLAFRDGDKVELQSKSSQSLTRYFPEIVAALRALEAPTCCSGSIRRRAECGVSSRRRRRSTSSSTSWRTPTAGTGNAPGGPSRWSTERSGEWQPLRPKLVVEVDSDHFSGGRFRHGTALKRFRPDKAPRQCTMDQLKQKRANLMRLLERA